MEAEEGSDHGEGIGASAPVPEPNISARDGAAPEEGDRDGAAPEEGSDATAPRTVPVLGMGHEISCACAGDGGGLRWGCDGCQGAMGAMERWGRHGGLSVWVASVGGSLWQGAGASDGGGLW